MTNNPLGARERIKGRQPDDLSTLPMTVEELRRRIRVRAGVWKGIKSCSVPRSTQFRNIDIALLAKLTKYDLYYWVHGRKLTNSSFGRVRLQRLCDVVMRIDAGLITKSQAGVYHFHDTPQVPPVRTMRVSLLTGTIVGGIKTAEYKRMPSVASVFGVKK